jgi:calnexin
MKAPFLEQFTDDWDTRWKPSHAKKEKEKGSTSEDEWAYVGNWAVEEPTVFSGMVGDKGLVVKDKAAHHAISAKFPKAINPKGKPLVVQYEVKLQGMCNCVPQRRPKLTATRRPRMWWSLHEASSR